ncbi:MAG TPA: nucleotidyltransferase domain-containing protein, partial [Propionibacteriaceae bacterium]|nr:nucleotidyltransferase domain-containing protein [Propionibacteriaceae bacterium]
MRDPGEGVAPDGTITTGVGRENVPDPYLPLLADAPAAVTGDVDDATVYLYGSVATGQARRRHSDVDLLAVELDRSAATAINTTLSARYRELCREVELATASRDD